MLKHSNKVQNVVEELHGSRERERGEREGEGGVRENVGSRGAASRGKRAECVPG